MLKDDHLGLLPSEQLAVDLKFKETYRCNDQEAIEEA